MAKKVVRDIGRTTYRLYREIFIKKYYVHSLVQKLDHLTCSKFEFTTTL